jgi:tetratricopeptide (TPR) repeat protein
MFFLILSVLFFAQPLNVKAKIIKNNLENRMNFFTTAPGDSILKALLTEDSLAKLSGDKDRLAMSKAKLGNYYYNRSPQTSIDYNKAAVDLFIKAKNKQWTALSYQNIAFAYEEGLKNYQEAIKYVDKAIPIWRELKDTMNEANILKYQGYLYGKIKEFPKAMSFINQAIEKFRTKKFEQGVGVCYFDLSQVYFEMGNIDSCKSFLLKSKAIYKKNNEYLRIFIVNNQLMRIHMNNDDYLTSKDFFDENEKIANKNEIYGEHLLEFYEMSEITLKRTNFLDKASVYAKKYSDLKQKLEQQGIKIKTD